MTQTQTHKHRWGDPIQGQTQRTIVPVTDEHRSFQKPFEGRGDNYQRIPEADRMGTIRLSRTGKSIIIETVTVGYVSLSSLDRVINGDSPYAVIKRPHSFES